MSSILPVHQMIQQYDHGGAFREGAERGKQSRIAQLAGQAQGATGEQRNSLLQSMAYTDPKAAEAQRTQFRQVDKDAGADLATDAARFVAIAEMGDEAGIQAAYASLAEKASGVMGHKLPAVYDKGMLGGIQKLASAASATGLPAGLQEFNAMSQGLSAEDNLKARRVALGLDGRASSAGFQQVKFTDGQGRDRVGVLNARTGVIDLPDGTSFNPQTGQSGPTQPEQAPPMQQQRAPGEVPFSIDPSLPPQVQAAIRANEPQWASAQEGAQMAIPQQGRPQTYRQTQGGDPFTSRSAEDQAALTTRATEQAKIDAEISNYDRMTGLEAGRTGVIEGVKTQAAIAQAGGTEEARQSAQTRVELQQLLPKVESESTRTVALIDKALNHPGREAGTGLSSTLDPRNYVRGTDASDFRVLLDQLKGGTFLQAFQSLKGGGAITQVEGMKAEQAIARLDQAQSDEEFMVALEELRGVAEGLPQSIRAKISAAGGPQGRPAGGAAPSVTTKAQYDSLPSGTVYMEDGKQYRKP